ncbi:acyltransferase family protein [Algibacter sp. L3A6]|uniref:acyltransferase family protein n=1 Tax=Algibacter sp. L3A6 TaxID=2686366 RepID=UPI00131EB153|nr:acyltransferase family protein [Algibacter sp. L3A6]
MKKNEVECLKGLAIIGVIFAHMNFKGRFDDSTLILVNYLQIIFGWCVIAFFFCSGLLAKNVDRFLLKQLIFKRFKRLIVPCIVFTITYKLIIFGLYYSGLFGWKNPLPENKLTLLYPVGPQFYFLIYLFIIQLIVSFLQLYFSRKVLLIMASIVLPILYFIIDSPKYSYGGEINLVPFYIYSYIIALFVSENKSIRNIDYYVLLILVLAFLSLSFNIKMIILIQLYIPILLWLILKKYNSITVNFNKLSIGKYSGAIYVWHAPILLPFLSITCVKLFGSKTLVIFPILIITILISIFLGKLTSRYSFLKIWRF